MARTAIRFRSKKEYVPVVVSKQAFGVLGALGFGLLIGCDPGCETTCRKVLKCDGLETSELTIGECTAECIRQTNAIDQAEDDELSDAFVAHKRCITSSSCDEILDGACYDEVLFPF